MACWEAFAAADPELAAFGAERFGNGVAYLATVRRDGSPRVHPVTPIIGGGHLFVFMEPTSPKGYDLRRDGRYMLHSAAADTAGSSGEFCVSGRATLVEDAAGRTAAARAASYAPADRFILFELEVDGAMSTLYEQGQPVRRRWGDP
jgi:hypothetical protein